MQKIGEGERGFVANQIKNHITDNNLEEPIIASLKKKCPDFIKLINL
jgi:hypothetical protein